MPSPQPPSEIRKLLRLAIPVVISQVGNMLMGLVDTIIVGRYSSTELAAVAAGNSIFFALAMIGMGFLTGMDPIIAGAHGAGDKSISWRCLGSAMQSALLFTLLSTPIILIAAQYFSLLGVTADVIVAAKPFLITLTLSLAPLLIFVAIQRYWQGLEIAVPFTVIILLGNVVNYFFADALVSGRYGMSEMGAVGAAWATFIVRCFCLSAAIFVSFKLWQKFPKLKLPQANFFGLLTNFDISMHRRLFAIGIPAAAQMALEVCAFSLTTLLIARLGALSLATHQIVLNVASFAFMFPLGLSAATATRVGYHVGQKNHILAMRTCWLGIYLSIAIMGSSAAILFAIPKQILQLFTGDQAVVELGISLIVLCALFQIFDGIQVVSSGALRGLGDTKTALYANLVAHWFLGLPIGLFLCFWQNLGLLGLWTGLAFGLFFTSIFNCWAIKGKQAKIT